MKYLPLMTLVLLASAGLTGCEKLQELQMQEGLAPGRGTTRTMGGEHSYQEVFATARQVLSQYFSIQSADPATGIIKTRPKDVQAGNERLLGGSPARQVATMQITQESGQVVAQVLVMQQRQGSAPMQQMGYSQERTNYTGQPGMETPADGEAATTPEQNLAWENEKAVHSVEIKILDDLNKALTGK
jgi:hypothetical protein